MRPLIEIPKIFETKTFFTIFVSFYFHPSGQQRGVLSTISRLVLTKIPQEKIRMQIFLNYTKVTDFDEPVVGYFPLRAYENNF